MNRCVSLFLFFLALIFSGCSTPQKVVFVSGKSIHLWGDHEHSIMCDILVDMVEESMQGKVDAFHFDMQKDYDLSKLENVDAVVIITEGEDNHPFDSKTDILKKINECGVNVGVFHYSLMFNKDEDNAILDNLIGGHYQKGFSYNPFYYAKFEEIGQHSITSGVKPFGYYDEWHFNISFSKDSDKKITPILQTKIPDKIRKRRSAPVSVRAELGKDKLETIAWVVENKNGTRGFGITGGHAIWTLAQKDYRKLVLNMIAWLAEVDIPQNGFDSSLPSFDSIANRITKPKRGDYDYYINDWSQLDAKWRSEIH